MDLQQGIADALRSLRGILLLERKTLLERTGQYYRMVLYTRSTFVRRSQVVRLHRPTAHRCAGSPLGILS